MSNSHASEQAPRKNAQGGTAVASDRTQLTRNTKSLARAALHQTFFEIHSKNRKRIAEAEKLKLLLHTLRKIQPCDSVELSAESGVSQPTAIRRLNKLIKLNLVIRTDFEQHSLYCINGDYNSLVSEVLDN